MKQDKKNNSKKAAKVLAAFLTVSAVLAGSAMSSSLVNVKASNSYSVSNTVIDSNAIYCSPNGGGNGSSINNPTDVLSAISSLKAGQTIYLLDGTYKFNQTIVINESNCGSSSAYKKIAAYPGAKVVWDFSALSVNDSNRGVVLDGSYWYFYGFEIAKAGDNGMLLSGDNNRIEMMIFNDNQDTGLQLSRYKTSYNSISQWPSNNYILNCTSKNNCDNKTMENADGFAAKLTCGEGNVFDGCMAYNNSDDGWDLYAKSATGPIGIVTIKNCIAFRNGYTEYGEGYGDCDGNGFKLGGSGVGSPHVVENCLAFENLNCGFTDNNNPELAKISGCTSVNNGIGNNKKPNFSVYRCNNCDFDNLMSYYNNSSIQKASDKFVGSYANGVYYNTSGGYYKVSSDTAVTNGEKIGSKFSGPSDSDFISTSAGSMGTDFHKEWRNSDGSLNTYGYFETKDTGSYSLMGCHFKNESKDDSSEIDSSSQTDSSKTDSSSQADIKGYISLFSGSASASNWDQAVTITPLKNDGTFNSNIIQKGGYFYIEYTGDKNKIELCLQSWSGASEWGKAAISESGETNGHYYVKFSYDNCVAALGTDNFAEMLDNLHIGAADGNITVFSVGYQNYDSDSSSSSSSSKTESSYNIADCQIILSDSSFTYTGNFIKPKVTVKAGEKVLEAGTDYVVRYIDNVEAGTAYVKVAGRGAYTGSQTVSFTITESSLKNISKCGITLNKTVFKYTGLAVKPKVTIEDGSNVLALGTDYAVRYVNNVNVGTASVVIAGKGRYIGSVTKTFAIIDNTTELSECTITIPKESYAYTGSAVKPKVTITYGSKTLELAADYSVRYTNNINKGTATIVISGKGIYSGTVQKTFKII